MADGAFRSVNILFGRSAPASSPNGAPLSLLRHWMGGAAGPSGQQNGGPISFLHFWMGGAGGSSRIPPKPNPSGGGGDEEQKPKRRYTPTDEEIVWVLINFTLSQDNAQPD